MYIYFITNTCKVHVHVHTTHDSFSGGQVAQLEVREGGKFAALSLKMALPPPVTVGLGIHVTGK